MIGRGGNDVLEVGEVWSAGSHFDDEAGGVVGGRRGADAASISTHRGPKESVDDIKEFTGRVIAQSVGDGVIDKVGVGVAAWVAFPATDRSEGGTAEVGDATRSKGGGCSGEGNLSTPKQERVGDDDAGGDGGGVVVGAIEDEAGG